MLQEVRSFQFQGHEIQYDFACTKSYKWQKAVNSGDGARVMGAVEQLFMGRDEELVDELFDDDATRMVELLQAVLEDSGGTAKN